MNPEDIALPPSRAESPDTNQPSIYKPVPPKQWSGIYPPILPPPDFFDREEEEEKLKYMFKHDNMLHNPLHDETGKANLPRNEKGILILDPVTRTRLVDVQVEKGILYDYWCWIVSVEDSKKLESGPGRKWLDDLYDTVKEKYIEVKQEWKRVVNEEREKRGLTDIHTNYEWYRKGYIGEYGGEEDGDSDGFEDMSNS